MIILLNLYLNYIYDIMENIIIDLRIKIQELEQENKALKSKITLMYSNWKFDYSRFMELKALIYKMNNTESPEPTIQSISDTTP